MAIEQIRSTNAALREAAILYLLDGEPTLRRAVASELQASQVRAASLSPESLRRLIGMRNWCPEKERPAVDAIIRAVRAKGIDCAAWPQGGAGTIHASGIDGSGAQGFLIVSPVGQKVQISSVLLKSGVRDAWSAPPASKRELTPPPHGRFEGRDEGANFREPPAPNDLAQREGRRFNPCSAHQQVSPRHIFGRTNPNST